jgi:hypothetical protein
MSSPVSSAASLPTNRTTFEPYSNLHKDFKN